MSERKLSLLVYGSVCDPHLASVAQRLDNLGVTAVFIDPFDPVSLDAKAPISEGARIVGWAPSLNEAKEIDIYQSALWFRNKLVIQNPQDQEQRRLCATELQRRHFLLGLASIENIRHFNDRVSALRAENKIYQLMCAKSIGLEAPTTLISNNPSDIIRFARRFGKIAVKTLASPVVPGFQSATDSAVEPTQKVILTQLTDAAELEQLYLRTPSALAAPAIYQQYLQKDYEARVIVCNGNALAVKISFASKFKNRVDYRAHALEATCEISEVPNSLTKRLTAYLRRTGLLYGVFDFVVDSEDKYWFLECNPDGQWYWLEIKLGDCGIISDFFGENLASFLRATA